MLFHENESISNFQKYKNLIENIFLARIWRLSVPRILQRNLFEWIKLRWKWKCVLYNLHKIYRTSFSHICMYVLHSIQIHHMLCDLNFRFLDWLFSFRSLIWKIMLWFLISVVFCFPWVARRKATIQINIEIFSFLVG